MCFQCVCLCALMCSITLHLKLHFTCCVLSLSCPTQSPILITLFFFSIVQNTSVSRAFDLRAAPIVWIIVCRACNFFLGKLYPKKTTQGDTQQHVLRRVRTQDNNSNKTKTRRRWQKTMPTATIHTTTTTYTAAHTQKPNVFEIHIAKIKLYMMKSEKKTNCCRGDDWNFIAGLVV